MIISPHQILTEFGKGVGFVAEKTHRALRTGSERVGGLPGAAGLVMADLTFGLGEEAAHWLGDSLVPGLNSVGAGITQVVPHTKIDPVDLMGELVPFITAPGGIIIGDLKAQLAGLAGLAHNDLLPLVRAWREAAHSGAYLIRYDELYRHVKEHASHWQETIEADKIPLFPPALPAIAAALEFRAHTPHNVFKLLDATWPSAPDPEALRQAVAADVAKDLGPNASGSYREREWMVGRHQQAIVFAQIAGVTKGAPTYLFRSLGECRKVESYIQNFWSLAPGSKAPKPPMAWCLLMYAAQANSHDPSDRAHVPFTPEQSKDAQRIADRHLVNVLGPELAPHFPGHSKTMEGKDSTDWVDMASVRGATDGTLHWK